MAGELAAALDVERPDVGSPFELSIRAKLLLAALGTVFVYLMLRA